MSKNNNETLYLDTDEVFAFLRKHIDICENFLHIINLKPEYNKIPKGYKAIYQLGDLDGSIAREVLIAIKSGHAQITEKGLKILFMLIADEHDNEDKEQLAEWQSSEDIYSLCDVLVDNIKVRKSDTTLVLIGDCMFDRFSNNISALMKLQKKLHSVGVIHIKGNHDIIRNRYSSFHFADSIPTDKRPAEQILQEHLDLVYKNGYYDAGSRTLYTHTGLARVEDVRDFMKKYCKSHNEEIKALQKELDMKSSNKWVYTGFGLMQYDANNPQDFVDRLNTQSDNDLVIPFNSRHAGEHSFLDNTKSYSMTSFRASHEYQFPCFKNVVHVHGHTDVISKNVLDVIEDDKYDKKSTEAFLKTGGVLSINARSEDEGITPIANVVLYKDKSHKK